MISWTEYRKYNETFWRGKQVRALHELINGFQRIPKGTVLTIRGKSSGFSLEAPKCSHCGVSVFIRKVEPGAVELVD